MTLTVLHKRNPVTGGCYRKTLQYGFDMQQAIDWRMGQVLNGLDPDKRSDNRIEATEADMYACGFLPPRFLVPARVYSAVYVEGESFYLDIIKNDIEYECIIAAHREG